MNRKFRMNLYMISAKRCPAILIPFSVAETNSFIVNFMIGLTHLSQNLQRTENVPYLFQSDNIKVIFLFFFKSRMSPAGLMP